MSIFIQALYLLPFYFIIYQHYKLPLQNTIENLMGMQLKRLINDKASMYFTYNYTSYLNIILQYWSNMIDNVG